MANQSKRSHEKQSYGCWVSFKRHNFKREGIIENGYNLTFCVKIDIESILLMKLPISNWAHTKISRYMMVKNTSHLMFVIF